MLTSINGAFVARRRERLSERSHKALPPNLSVATSVQVVESTVTTAIDDLDELADLGF